MRRLLLALLFVLAAAAPAQAEVSVVDPADAPASVYDVEALTVGYDPAGTMTLTWRLHQSFPRIPPEGGTAYLAASVFQQQDYSLDCRVTGLAGDLNVVLDYSTAGSGGAVPGWDAGYHVFGRSGMTEAPVRFSDDRREATVTITDAALAGHAYFCANATSGQGDPGAPDQLRDETAGAYFPGFEPIAPVLGGPPDGAVFRGATPELGWDVRPSSGDWIEVWNYQPTPSGVPPLRLGVDEQSRQGRIRGTRTGTSFRFTAPLADGVYWWGVTRLYGRTALRSYKRFEVGPPDLTTLTLARNVRRGSAKLTVKATRGATGTLVVKRGARTVKTLKFTIKTDKTSPQLTVPLPCSKAGRRYTAKVTASDRYGTRLNATRSWTVSRSRCAR